MMNKLSSWLILTVLALLCVGNAHAGTHHHYYTDPQGNVLAKTDAQGNIIARYDYAPYGASVTASGMSAGPDGPGYTGHVNDPDTGLVYMQARYYDPAVGRFLSTDPVTPLAGNAFNFGRYGYGNNNPVVHTDPDGRQVPPGVPEVVPVETPPPEIAKPVEEPIPVPVEPVVPLTPEQVTEGAKALESVKDEIVKTYQTYTRKNDSTGQVYSGRTSGKNSPQQNVSARNSDNHHMSARGYGPATLDRSSTNSSAIRGREQQLIEANGGAQSRQGTSGNTINGVSPNNPKATHYENEANNPDNYQH
jgi:RHS repeat-associated protein